MRRGSALIEFSLAGVVLVTMAAGAAEYGQIFFTYGKLQEGISRGIRYAVTRNFTSSCPEQVDSALRNMVVYGTPRPLPGAQPLVTGLEPRHIEVGWEKDAQAAPSDVSLAVRGFAIDSAFGRRTFSGQPEAKAAYLGRVVAVCQP
jgi:hypothetical protein